MKYIKKFIKIYDKLFKKINYYYQVSKIENSYDYKVPESLRSDKDFIREVFQKNNVISFKDLSQDTIDSSVIKSNKKSKKIKF